MNAEVGRVESGEGDREGRLPPSIRFSSDEGETRFLSHLEGNLGPRRLSPPRDGMLGRSLRLEIFIFHHMFKIVTQHCFHPSTLKMSLASFHFM